MVQVIKYFPFPVIEKELNECVKTKCLEGYYVEQIQYCPNGVVLLFNKNNNEDDFVREVIKQKLKDKKTIAKFYLGYYANKGVLTEQGVMTSVIETLLKEIK